MTCFPWYDTNRADDATPIVGPFHVFIAAIALVVLVILAPVWAPLLAACALADRSCGMA